jgi:hypothetical protein
MPQSTPEIPTTIIAETENYMVWTAAEPDGEMTWNLELGAVTVHLFKEEWDEFVTLMKSVKK